jgi:hypothetical protein
MGAASRNRVFSYPRHLAADEVSIVIETSEDPRICPPGGIYIFESETPIGDGTRLHPDRQAPGEAG